MRILHVVDSLHAITGGPSRTVTRLADEQSAAGHSVMIVANNYRELGENIMPDKAAAHFVPARRLPFRMGAWSPGLAGAILGQARSSDIIHVHGLWLRTNHLGCQAASRIGKPLVVSPRGMLEAWSLQHRALRKAIVWNLHERAMLRSAFALHATAEAEANAIRKLLPQAAVVVAPNGIDCPASTLPRSIIESCFPATANRRLLVFLSRLHPKKGIPELLESWRQLREKFPEWLLVIAGDDYDGWLTRYQDMAHGLNLGNDVVFTGALEGEKKLSLLGACEAFVLPSHSENFGLAIGEALAAGKPVITTHATPWAELESERCGWWIPVGGDPLTAALAEALALPSSELVEMGRRGAALIADRYSWRNASAVLLETYGRALDPNRQ
jgi:glycosyltransferase involved in cell wall biosynthesis